MSEPWHFLGSAGCVKNPELEWMRGEDVLPQPCHPEGDEGSDEGSDEDWVKQGWSDCLGTAPGWIHWENTLWVYSLLSSIPQENHWPQEQCLLCYINIPNLSSRPLAFLSGFVQLFDKHSIYSVMGRTKKIYLSKEEILFELGRHSVPLFSEYISKWVF